MTTPQPPPSEYEYFKIFYTDQIRKKHRSFKDGFIKIKGKNGELFNDDGKSIAKSSGIKLEYDERDVLTGFVGNYLVEVDTAIPASDFVSGRCYLANYVPPSEKPVQPVAPLGPPPLGKKIIASSSSLMANKHLVPVVFPTGKQPTIIAENTNSNSNPLSNSSSQQQPPLLRKFKNPLEITRPDESSTDPSKVHTLCTTSTPGVMHKCIIEEFLYEMLMPHQIEGVQFMFDCLTGVGEHKGLTGCILGDSMGLGKTLQILTLVYVLLRQNPSKKDPFAKKVLIVTPVSLVKNWAEECKNW